MEDDPRTTFITEKAGESTNEIQEIPPLKKF